MTNKSVDYIQRTVFEIDSLLSESKTEAALKKCTDLLEQWESRHVGMCMFLQHEHLDPIENILATLPFYIEQNEILLARAECRSIYSLTEHVIRTEEITFENIL